MTGAIPKFPIPQVVLYVNDDEPDKTTCVSYKMKIRHVCNNCAYIIELEWATGSIKPIHHALPCTSCEHKALHRMYAKLCTICCLEKIKCACCEKYYNEYEGTRHPFHDGLTPGMKMLLNLLPTDYKRGILRYLLHLWRKYKKGKMSLYDVREKVGSNMLFWYLHFNPHLYRLEEINDRLTQTMLQNLMSSDQL